MRSKAAGGMPALLRPETIRVGQSAISLLLCPGRSRATPAVADDAAATALRTRRQVKSVGVGSDSREVP